MQYKYNAIRNAYLTDDFHYNLQHERSDDMAFKIQPDKKESENKTIRFPLPLLERIEDAIAGESVTFSGFVIQACEYALNEMELDDDK